MLAIQTNSSSLNTQRVLSRTERARSRATERLASGSRINSAADDAAGLAISNRMSASLRSLNQVVRNLNDGFSLAQSADAGIAEIENMIGRMRELAVQAANDVNTLGDRRAIQSEVVELLEEIDQIAERATYNGITLLDNGTGRNMVAADPEKLELLDNLKTSWLQQAEEHITQFFGVTADGVDLEFVFADTDDGPGNRMAFVSSSYFATGRATVNNMTFDMEDYDPEAFGDYDRLIAHELTHAVMARTVNWGHIKNNAVSNGTWFLEGTAEFIHGADNRLANAVTALGGGVPGADAVAAKADDAWDSSSEAYAAGYAAVAYLHDYVLNTVGDARGIRAVFDALKADPDVVTLDQAISTATAGAFADERAFLDDFTLVNGSAFIQARDLTNADTGSVAGSDSTPGNPSLNADDVIPDDANYTDNPLVGFDEIFPHLATGEVSTTVTLQAGTRKGNTIDVALGAADTISLGISALDLVFDADGAMIKLDQALDFLNSQRTTFGALMNRLEHSMRSVTTHAESVTASRSRIRDTDFAQETALHTRAQIQAQAATQILRQVALTPAVLLELLR